MSDRRYFTLSPKDIACRLGLIYKVHGIKEAEKYFDRIPKGVLAFGPYDVLLRCYVEENNVKKAEALAQTMEELELGSSFSYNLLMKLYSQTGQQEKINNLLKEMEEKGISPDKFTFYILINAFGFACNVDGIEKLLKEMKKDPRIVIDWYTLALVAKGYMQAGCKDKAITMLKKAENLVPLRKNKIAFSFLLTLYGDLEQKDDLYRIWNHYSTSERTINSVYSCMIGSLLKLDDIEGAERILETWESCFIIYDFRVPSILIAAYCKRHLFEKAESYINTAIARGRKPSAYTWDRLASAYLEDKRIQKAVETLKKALVIAPCFWKPNPVTVDASLEYFEQQGDVEGAENFVRLLRPIACLTREVYHRLLKTYILARKPVSSVLGHMEQDGFNVDNETTKILEDMTCLKS
uniref:Pentatricopeptide repeat-containing protein At2g20710, mitochondrial n=1 Tax=Anthurium amnicola TaxID=1678845 RepID=A0A1D1YWN7_9ARAE